MSEKWKLRFGQEAFKQFILNLSAIHARNVALGDRDPLIPPCHTVSRAAMLDRFLAARPDLNPFCVELADVYDILPAFCVNTILWNQLPVRL